MGTWACLEAQPLLSYRAPQAETTCLRGVPHAPRRGHVAKVFPAHGTARAPSKELPKPETLLPKRVRMGGACLPC